jgi:hypothetical protein
LADCSYIFTHIRNSFIFNNWQKTKNKERDMKKLLFLTSLSTFLFIGCATTQLETSSKLAKNG